MLPCEIHRYELCVVWVLPLKSACTGHGLRRNGRRVSGGQQPQYDQDELRLYLKALLPVSTHPLTFTLVTWGGPEGGGGRTINPHSGHRGSFC